MSLKIYHNPRCSKSRQTLALLTDSGHTPQIIDYLNAAPGIEDLRGLVDLLGVSSVRDIMRTGETVYKELGLKAVMDEDKLLQAINTHPKLLERPIVVKDDKAAIGRPPEAVMSLF